MPKKDLSGLPLLTRRQALLLRESQFNQFLEAVRSGDEVKITRAFLGIQSYAVAMSLSIDEVIRDISIGRDPITAAELRIQLRKQAAEFKKQPTPRLPLERAVKEEAPTRKEEIGPPTAERRPSVERVLAGEETIPAGVPKVRSPEKEKLRAPEPVSTEVGMEAFPTRERGMPRGGLIGGKPAGEAIAQAQAQEQRKQKVLEDVLEAGSRLETPFQHAKRALRQADLIKAEDPSLEESDAVVNLRATIAARELSEQERGVPAEYEPGAEGQPDWMFARSTPEALTTAAGREDLERRRAQLKAMDLRLGGYDPERQARAEQRRLETGRAVSRGYGYSDQPGMRGPFNVESYAARQRAVRRNLEPLVAQNKELRPEQKERYRKYGKQKDRRGRPILYTSPLDNALRRRG